MRTLEHVKSIEENNSNPFQLYNFISRVENQELIKFYDNNDKEIKATGPTVVRPNLSLPVFKKIFNRVQETIGEDVRLQSALIFSTPWAHVIHNDDDVKGNAKPYKALTIPLELWGTAKDTDIKLMMFDQYYYHGGKKFYNGGPAPKKIANNPPLLEYKDVSYINNKGIPYDVKKEYLTHLQDNWLEGLSIHSYFPWKINSAIIFDSTRLHSSSNFNAIGVTRKLALSIFTYLP